MSVQFSKGSLLKVRIEKLALGGRGIGFVEKMPVFVEDGVPGDLVEVRVFKLKKNFLEAQLVRVLEGSPDGITPRCRHFGTCGGCAWQFLPYEKQLEWKERQVRETLQHLGGFAEPPVKPIIGSSESWFYRNKMEWSFDRGQAGFHVRGRWHDVVNVEECFLQSEKSLEIFRALRDFFAKFSWQPKSVAVREGKRTGEMMLILYGSDEFLVTKIFGEWRGRLGDSERADALVQMFQKFPEIVSVAYVQTGVKGGPKETLIFGKPFYREELIIRDTRLQFHVRPQAFFQPNTFMAEKMYEHILSLLNCGGAPDSAPVSQSQDIVFDLFCGTGTIGLCIAPFVREIFGIESEPSSIESARENAALNGATNISFFVGTVQNLLPSLTEQPNVIVLDPPRAGVPEKALEVLVGRGAKKLIYVSCNPATFARDAIYLRHHGYELCTVQPFDQFPHTAHIELVASFLLATK